MSLGAGLTARVGRPPAIDAFGEPVTLALKYDKARVEDPRRLAIHMWNPAIARWVVGGGEVDEAAAVIRLAAARPGIYAVMAFEPRFGDIGEHWARSDIEEMVARRVITGVTDDSFAPDLPVTRAQFAVLLWRVLELPPFREEEPLFTDVPPDAWYYKAVEAASRGGLVQGNGRAFRPDEPITRQEMAVALGRAAEMAGRALDLTDAAAEDVLAAFRDAGSIPAWSRVGVARAIETGLLRGQGGSFRPEGITSRAEAATVIRRLIDLVAEAQP